MPLAIYRYGEKTLLEDDMKKKLLILAGFALLATSLFAAGAQEDALAQYRDKVTLTGTLQFKDGFPELNVGGKAYAVMAPGAMREVRFLKPGLRMTVEGYKVNAMPRSPRPDMEHVYAEKVTIDGKTFDLSKNAPFAGRGGRMMDGSGRGPMSGGRWSDDDRGPGTGPRGRTW